MRSAASLGHPICICLLVIATVTFHQCVGQNKTIEWRRFERATSNSDKAPEKKTNPEGFLIGQDTPVWLAFNNGDGMKFRRYDIPGYSQRSVAGEAIQYYMNNKRYMKFEYTDRQHWRVNSYTKAATAYPPSQSNPNEDCGGNNGCNSDLPQWKEENMKNVYPTALVIFDLQHLESIASHNARREVAKRITYISTFWKMVNIKLNNLIKSTKIRMRIAGIILAETSNAFAAWTGTWKPTLQDTLNGMKDSFDDPTWTNQFPRDSYDFVAFMTSASVGGDVPYLPQGASSWRVPCTDDNHRIGDIMIWDNFSFLGLEAAVQEIINVLGPHELEHRMNLIPRTVWKVSDKWKPNKCSLHRVAAFLPLAWCLSTPKEHFPPGKPVRSILPGEMLTLGQYCATLGYKQYWQGPRLNPASLILQCGLFDSVGGHRMWSPIDAGRPLDGTTCSSKNTMVCMDGECVINKWEKSY